MMNRFKNPWSIQDEQQKVRDSQRLLLAAMAKKAKEILADEKFSEYKSMYEAYHEREMENIMVLNEQDPIKYAFKVRQIVDTLKAYRLLISSIEQDAALPVEEAK